MDPLRAFFERLAKEWDAQQPPDREERLRQLLAAFRPMLRLARSILEVGTGTGALSPLLGESAPAARVISIDLAHAMLQHARQRCAEAYLAQADAHRLPFASGAFDLVVCHNVFPHFRDKPTALAELARTLCPGGHVLIFHDLNREQVNAIHREVGGAVGNDLLPPGEDLHRLLVAAGFTAVSVEDGRGHYQGIGRRRALVELA